MFLLDSAKRKNRKVLQEFVLKQLQLDHIWQLKNSLIYKIRI